MHIYLHADLDAFFATVEILDHPEYQGVPLVVGADPKGGKGRGVVSTCSYEARIYGLRSGMPISQAYRLCPQAIYVFPRGRRYEDFSTRFKALLKRFNPIYRSGGIDEAYLDITEKVNNFDEAETFGHQIQQAVVSELGLSCSIGISFTMNLAKIATDYHKPRGLTVFTPENFKSLLYSQDIACIPGVGKKTKHIYYERGFNKVGDLYESSLPAVTAKLGNMGVWAWYIANGVELRHEDENTSTYRQKSVSKERTFMEDVTDPAIIIQQIDKLNTQIHRELEADGLFYRTMAIKIRFEGFETYTRSTSLPRPARDSVLALEKILGLLAEFAPKHKKVRLIGIRFTNFDAPACGAQITLA